MHLALDILVPHLANDLVEDRLGEAVLENAAAGSKVEAEEAVEHTIGSHPGLLHQLGEFVDNVLRGQIGLGRVGIVVLLNHPLEMDGREDGIFLEVQEHLLHQHIAILHELLDQIRSLGNCFSQKRLELFDRETEHPVNILERHETQVDGLGLYLRGIHTVLAVAVLDNHTAIVANRTIVLDPHILHRLHHTTLDVTRVRGLHGRVNETLATAHRVEEVLGRTETLDERGLHETTGLNAVIELGEVGEGTILESVLNTLAVHDLLAEDCDHLCNVQARPLGTRLDHLNQTVGGRQGIGHLLRDLSRDIFQSITDLVLQLFAVRTAAVVEELAGVDVGEDLLHTLAALGKNLGHELGGLLIGLEI